RYLPPPPLPYTTLFRSYPHINENDILFSKMVWETIPLDERANLIYYYPERETEERKPLFKVLLDAVKSKDITEIYESDDFKVKLNFEQLKDKFTRKDTMPEGFDQLLFGEQIRSEERRVGKE